MNLITIYKDNEKKVEMPQEIVDIFNKTINEFFTLKKEDMEKVLDKSVGYLKEMYLSYVSLEGKSIITSSDVPRLHRGKIFELSSYGIPFEDAVFLLSDYFDKTKGKLTSDWKYKLEHLILLHYQLLYNTDCIVHIFDENYLGVSGFMSIAKNDLLLIHFFYLNEDGIFYSFPQ